MAAYKDLVGQKITVVTSNPPEPKTGQMWYNSAAGKLRGLGILEAWSSASPTGRSSQGGYYGSIGTSTSSLALVGSPGNSSPLQTEEWNGTGWSASDNMAPYSGISGNMTPQGGSSGTVTSALYAGGEMYTGNTRAKAQEYDGSSWTSITDMPQNTGYNVGIGTASNTSIMVGGYNESYAFINATVDWSGSSWTAGGSLGTARWGSSGGGTETAGWYSGGKTGSYPGTSTTATENYNGTAWSTGDALNTARWLSGGTGPQTSAMVIGERPSPGPGRGGNTEVYNGTAWAETSDLATARVQFKGTGGTSTAALVGGGNTPPNVANTEEFNSSINSVNAAAWSSGGNLNTGRELGGNAGTSTAGLLMSGKVYPNSFKNETEEYSGSSWSEQSNVSTARATSGAGTQTAGIIFGGTNGAPGSTGVQTATEEYDGSSWTGGGALSTARLGLYGAGTQTACFGAGGIISTNSAVTTVEDYNGSSWTSGTALPTAQQGGGAAGTPSARLVFGGYSPYANFTVEGDGEGWTSGGNMLDARGQLAGFGSQTDALACAGSTSPPNVDTTGVEGYDGTSWATRPSLSTERMGLAPSGSYNTTTGGMVVGGSNSGNPMRNQTEEWNAETTSANITNFSTE